MNIEGINWDEVPETLSLEQLYQLIHVSKRVAKSLVENEIPCIKSDKETHNYSINKRDLIEYLGTHLGTHSLKWHYIDHDPEPSLLITSIPDTVRYRMSTYLTTQLAGYPDLLKARDVSAITGYGKTTIGNWLKEGRLRYTVVRRAMYISKFELIEYMCTDDYDSVCRKSLKHKELIKIIKDAKD